MARFVILLFEPFGTTGWEDAPQEVLEAHGGYAAEIERLGGKLLSGEALFPTPQAKTIRGGAVTDGPAVDSKEGFLAFNVIEAKDLDHAVEIAKACPLSPGGYVEVRPAIED
ncbi:YciI family protein [Streptomyces sp. Da 82-17]|uniref:YciI family protein n=1 Tax=Streptomyces sp. Da 82-17 TaxID=3377116 RepID=UPI0038D47F4B